jgi:hypothetical protein
MAIGRTFGWVPSSEHRKACPEAQSRCLSGSPALPVGRGLHLMHGVDTIPIRAGLPLRRPLEIDRLFEVGLDRAVWIKHYRNLGLGDFGYRSGVTRDGTSWFNVSSSPNSDVVFDGLEPNAVAEQPSDTLAVRVGIDGRATKSTRELKSCRPKPWHSLTPNTEPRDPRRGTERPRSTRLHQLQSLNNIQQ